LHTFDSSNGKKMTKAVKDLRTGDILSSGTEIVKSPVEFYGYPKGRMEVVVKYANGQTKKQYWGRFTNVSVRETI
jgi:hypothetical protein